MISPSTSSTSSNVWRSLRSSSKAKLSATTNTRPCCAARIEDARKIANFRNVIVHEYNLLDDAQIWNIATDAAPVLKLQIDRWLGELDQA